jgi:O-antigen ligase
MSTLSTASLLNRTRLGKIADGLAVAVAVSIPWSTSATSILLVGWLIALIPTLEWRDLRSQLTTAVGGIPVLLFLLGAVGMTWADVTWHERWGGLDGFVRLLVIPLLITQFRRSDAGYRVLVGFLISCIGLLIASYVVKMWPNIHPRPPGNDGVAVKSYIVQSLEFTICAAVLFDLAADYARTRSWNVTAVFVILGLAFLGDIFFITTGRTALVVIPALVLIYGFQHFGWKGILGAGAAGLVVATVVWTTSPYVRERVTGIYSETEIYEKLNERTSAGVRVDFWAKSLRMIENAPLFGHGTGSIVDQFNRAAIGQTGARGNPSANPHNQTFAVGVQLGLLGIAVLWAMWISQVMLFRGTGSLAWIGLVVVTSNIVGSLFNSFIFDFTEGWLYVMGFGVTAGMFQRQAPAAQGHKGSVASTSTPSP